MAMVTKIVAEDLGLDPYWMFAQGQGFQGFGMAEKGLVPLVAECEDSVGATRFIAEFNKEFKEEAAYGFEGSRFITIYARRDRMIDEKSTFLDSLKGLKRWEFSAPFFTSDLANFTTWLDSEKGDPWKDVKLWGFEGALHDDPPKPVVAFIDYGAAFAHRKFRTRDSSSEDVHTRVLAIWDQGARVEANPRPFPTGKQGLSWIGPIKGLYGLETFRTSSRSSYSTLEKFLKNAPKLNFEFKVQKPGIEPSEPNTLDLNGYINQFVKEGVLDEAACYRQSGYSAIDAPFTHGTHIMDVATGFPDPLGSNDDPRDSDIIFVQLPRFFDRTQVSGLLKSYVIDALRYIFYRVNPLAPLTVNLSYGSNCGPHNGDSIIEQALDEMIRLRRKVGGVTNLVLPSGNAYERGIHAFVSVPALKCKAVQWANPPDNPTYQFIELWIDGEQDDDDTFAAIRLTPPNGKSDQQKWTTKGEQLDVRQYQTTIATIIAQPRVPQSEKGRMVLIVIQPTADGPTTKAAPYGLWTIEIKAGVSPVKVNVWCERDDPVFGSGSGPRQGAFTTNVAKQYTLNSIAHGQETIVVGGIDAAGFEASYSGSGPQRNPPTTRVSRAHASTGTTIWALSEDTEGLEGVSGAGVLGDTVIRLPGTSVAAAVVTRHLVANPGITSKVDLRKSILPAPKKDGDPPQAPVPQNSRTTPPIRLAARQPKRRQAP
jgi:hypothetical protein